MFDHTAVWHGIDRLAQDYGYSASGLARAAGLDPTSFNKSKRFTPDGRQRWPSTESITKILIATGASMQDFVRLMELQDGKTPEPANDRDACSGESREAVSAIPVLAQSTLAESPNPLAAPPGDPVPEKKSIVGADVFGIVLETGMYEPLFRKGDTILVSPSRQTPQGARTAVLAGGDLYLGRLVKRSMNAIHLAAFDRDQVQHRLETGSVQWTGPILWASQD